MNRHVSCLVQNQSSPAMFTSANTWDCRWGVNFTLWRCASRGSGDFPPFTRSESEFFRKTETYGNFHVKKRFVLLYGSGVSGESYQTDRQRPFSSFPNMTLIIQVLPYTVFLRKSHISRNVFTTRLQVSKCVCEKHLSITDRTSRQSRLRGNQDKLLRMGKKILKSETWHQIYISTSYGMIYW